MRRMFGARYGMARISKRLRPFCTNNKPNGSSNNSCISSRDEVDGSLTLSTHHEAYRQLDKLDFMTAANILFTSPPKKNKFGVDFHLVQLFFVCMPSLAVYLVAQYARHQMRRMETELELKKQAEEAKLKEMELNASEEKEAEAEAGSDPEILKVKVRLDKLEEAVKEIVVESKKQSGSTVTKNQNDGSEKRHHISTELSATTSRSESINSAAKDHTGKQTSENVAPSSCQGKASGSAAPSTDASEHGQRGTASRGPAKK